MKNPVPLLADLVRFSHKHHGTRFQPSLRARMKYGARLKRVVRFEQEEFDPAFGLTNEVRNGIYSRGCE